MAASNTYGHRYVIIGVPNRPSRDVDSFIRERSVGTIPHVLGEQQLWDAYEVKGTPAWIAIMISGEKTRGTGVMPASLFRGDWTE